MKNKIVKKIMTVSVMTAMIAGGAAMANPNYIKDVFAEVSPEYEKGDFASQLLTATPGEGVSQEESLNNESKDVRTEKETTEENLNLPAEKPDGDYHTNVETSSAMFRVVKSVLTRKNGMMRAKITLSGTGYDKLYMGSAAEAPSRESEWIAYTTDDEGKYVFEVPVSALDTPLAVAAHSVSKDQWYDRTITFQSEGMEFVEGTENPGENEENSPSETDPSPEIETEHEMDSSGATEWVDYSTELVDGVYEAEDFTVSGGTGKVTISCTNITVINGKVYATIQFSSEKYHYLKASGKKYTGLCENGTSVYTIPLKLCADNMIIGTTVAMGNPRDVSYIIKASVLEAVPAPETTPVPEVTLTPETTPIPESTPTPTPVPQETPDEVENGDYHVEVETGAAMFKVIRCVLHAVDGNYTAEITLSGTGYNYLFMGSAEQAEQADSSQWISYTIDSEGKYTYTIPAVKLDVPLAVASHSLKNDQWYDRTMIFKSETMSLIENSEETSGTEEDTEDENNHDETTDTQPEEHPTTPDIESWYESDLSGGTSAVNNSTLLPDGVYVPDKFSWSGGTGRVSIHCPKVTVSGGKAYATIVFSSDSYAYLKANGNQYTGSCGGGTSAFTIPVQLNVNNTVIGMTTKMSAAHEIHYSIFVYIASAAKESVSDNNQDNQEAPEIAGLEYTDAEELRHAQYFKIFHNDQGITLIEIKLISDCEKPEKKDILQEAEMEELQDTGTLISELYRNNTVKYLLVPEGVEIPVGLEKEMIVIALPVNCIYTASETAEEMVAELDAEHFLTLQGTEGEKPEYKELLKEKCDLVILSGIMLQNEQRTLFEEVTERLTLLGIPAIVDCCAQEKSEEAKLEWIKVYGALLGCEEQAEMLYQESVSS